MTDPIPFTFLGSSDHYDADLVGERYEPDYCCEPSEDYVIEFTKDDFQVWHGDVRKTCRNLSDVAQAIVEALWGNKYAFEQHNVCRCENCGGYWIKGDLPEKSSLGCRHVEDVNFWYDNHAPAVAQEIENAMREG